jgi:hypothetical protein
VLYQHHQCHITQALLLEELHEWRIDISTGQIDVLVSSANEDFLSRE